MRIRIDQVGCIGSGQCTLIAPDIFAQDDKGVSYLLPGVENGSADPLVRQAELGCPVHAITVVDD